MNHCPGCARPFSKTPGHLINTLPGLELVPYCNNCHSRLTLGAKKSYITGLINLLRYKNVKPDLDTAWEIALNTVDDEQRRTK